MFDSRKLSLNILPNDSNVNIIMAIINGGERVAKVYIGKEIQVFVEFVVVVVFGVDPFFRDHDTQQDTFVFLQEFSFLAVLKGEVLDHVEFNRDISCLKYIQNAFFIKTYVLVISGPIPMPEMRVTLLASPRLGLWSSALYQVALLPRRNRFFGVSNFISTLDL